jgi:hypothetical protein
MKYMGSVFFLVYDFEEKQLVYQKKVDLLPFIDSFSLPQMNDTANLCELDVDYERKGIKVRVKSALDKDSNCRTEFQFTIENEMNFKGVHTKNTKSSQSMTELKPHDEDQKYFMYNTKEYLNECSFLIDINPEKTTDKFQIDSDMLSKNNTKQFTETFRTPLENDVISYSTGSESPSTDCYGHYDYGRGVFFYKTNWIWSFAQGKATKMVEGQQPETVKFAINLGGGMGEPSLTKSGEDHIKVNDKVINMNSSELKYDPLNYMNGFIIQTTDKFKERGTNQMDLVFTSQFQELLHSNYLVVAGNLDYVWGKFDGYVIDDEGNKIIIKDLPGIMEFMKLKW